MSYKGKLLVAHPSLTEGIFARSVIFVYQDDPSGSMGLVLNKPTQWKVSQIIREKGLIYEGNEHIYKGGPVNEQALILLHEDDWYASNTMQIGKGLAITSDTVMMQKLSEHNGPTHWRMFAGIAGWSPGQLKMELKSRQGWLTCDADDSIVFDKDGERQWNKAIQMCANQMINHFF